IWADVGAAALVYRGHHLVPSDERHGDSFPAGAWPAEAIAAVAHLVAHVVCGHRIPIGYLADWLAYSLRKTTNPHAALAAEGDCRCSLGAASDRDGVANHHRAEPSTDAAGRCAMVRHHRDSGASVDGGQLVGISSQAAFHRRDDDRGTRGPACRPRVE